MIRELASIKKSIKYASSLGLKVNAGHGLNYLNVQKIASIPEIQELNIGHSIISRAVFSGLSQAVKEMNTPVLVHVYTHKGKGSKVAEKDAVKCRFFAEKNIWYIPVHLKFQNSTNLNWLKQIEDILKEKLA